MPGKRRFNISNRTRTRADAEEGAREEAGKQALASHPLLSNLHAQDSHNLACLGPRMGRGQQISPTVATKKSTMMIEVTPAAVTEISGDVCLLSESPYKVLKMAAKGRIQELKNILYKCPEKVRTTDAKGRTALHHAVLNGQLEALGCLLDHGADLAAVDNNGDTGLHLAITEDKREVVVYLLKHEAPTDVLNNLHRAPIHVAVEKNKHEILEILVKHKTVDVNLADGEGSTPLHYSAWKDHPDCARILLEAGAMMCKANRVGLFPLHVAAQSASSNTLQTMLDYAEKAGYKRESVLKFMSQEKLTPLHAAISSGQPNAVRICIDAGAHIDVTQEDGCNAIHLAASQGATDLIRLMFQLQPSKVAACVFAKDKQDMTPLHKAALFDRDDTVSLLLEQQADLSALCEGGYTPYMLAAAKSSWRSLTVMLKTNPDLSVKDNVDRNLIHLIIKNGGKPAQLQQCLCQKKFMFLLDERDQFGCTPLHYASKEGQLDTIESLLKLGAVLNVKNNSRQSPLHFAARYGRYNTCKRLIQSSLGHVIINETDENGNTPIHVAAQNGHMRVVQLLLQNGAGLYRDMNGNTPLHLAAMNGFTHTMSVLCNIYPQLINNLNKERDTPLHVAARKGQASAVTLLLSLGAKLTKNASQRHFVDEAIMNQQTDVCVAIVSDERWREALSFCSSVYTCPMFGFIKNMPDICQMVLDRCKTPSSCDKKDKDFHYTYDFKFLQLSVESIRKLKADGKDHMPMMALNLMVQFNREKCLSHPVCLQFLKTKWTTYGLWFHLINLLVYVAFLTSLTVFVASYKGPMGMSEKDLASGLYNTTDNGSTGGSSTWHHVELRESQHFLVYFIISFCCLNVVKELAQMFQQKLKYFMDFTNALEWILYISCGVFIGPFMMKISSNPQWECGALSIFLAWFNLLLFLQRFDFFGIYVVMFLEILRTLVQVIIVFSVLIIAFGLSFYILLSDVDDTFVYRNPALSLMTTVVMMLGSIDYTDNWVLPIFSGDALHIGLRAVMLIIFVLLMPILLINLLIGLAVGDIESVQRNARLKRLAMQVELHTDIEKKLPQKILEKFVKPTWKCYPNKCHSWMERFGYVLVKSNTPDDNPIGDHLNSDIQHQEFIFQELNCQKKRIKGISSDLQKQYELMKLIVQKMEIRSEADEMDEGEASMKQEQAKEMRRHSSIGWSAPNLRTNILKQSAVVNKWKNVTGTD